MPVMIKRQAGTCSAEVSNEVKDCWITGKFHAHHDHAGDPEEEDVVPCLQQRCRVVLGQIRRLLRPAKHREGEQARGKPGVQHIIVLPLHNNNLSRQTGFC